MTQKRWRFTVSELGSATAIHDLTVEASDWVTALTRARAQLGERGGVPPGAMCNVTADGKVMLMDGVGRKQYRLEPAGAASVTPAALTPSPAVPVSGPAVPGPAAKRAPRPTMAYTSLGAVPAPVQPSTQASAPVVAQAPVVQAPVAQPLAQAPVAQPVVQAPMAQPLVQAPVAQPVVQAPVAQPVVQAPMAQPLVQAPVARAVVAPVPVVGQAARVTSEVAPVAAKAPKPTPLGAKAEPTKVARPRFETVAYMASDTVREPTVEAPPALLDPTLPEASGSELSAMAGASKLYERDAEPTKESPLLYRERHYFVPETVSKEEARAILLQLFEEIRESIATRPKGKLVKMAVFDHAWTGQPQRPPFLSLQWKDWRGEPEIVDGPRALSAEAEGRAQADREMQERMEEQAWIAAEQQRIAELQAQAREEDARLAAEERAALEATLQAEAQAAAHARTAALAQAQAEAQAAALAVQAEAQAREQALELAARMAAQTAQERAAQAQAAQAQPQAVAAPVARAPAAVGGWQSAAAPAPSVPPPAMPSVMISPELLEPQEPMASVMISPELLVPQESLASVMISPELLVPQESPASVMISPELQAPIVAAVVAPVVAAVAAPAVAGAPAPLTPSAARAARVGTSRPTPATLGDDRLADAFEGLQDLAFLQTPLEAAEFVIRLLGELIPCEAVSVALYDINANEMRFVASSGVGAAERKGDAVPTNVGILGRALLNYVRPTRVNDVPADASFDPGVDGRVGLEVQTMIAKPLAVGDRLLGAMQLLNRRNDFEFSLADENLLVYVSERLSDFLEKAKARGNPKRSVAR